MRVALAALALLASGLLGGCAKNECRFHSQCGRHHYCVNGECRQDCYVDTDCRGGLVCNEVGMCVSGTTLPPTDASLPDAARDAGADTASPPLDSGARDTGPTDSGSRDTGPADSGPRDTGLTDSGPTSGTKAYLDRCTSASECASDLCLPDVGGTRFCSKTCAAHYQCADEHVCASGICARDDTGEACPVSDPARCALGLCLGPPGGTGTCTRQCDSAVDCPAGYACAVVSGIAICVNVEKPCTDGGSECELGLCTTVGCTAPCRSAADCPLRATALGVPPYTCGPLAGVAGNVCIPPEDILGGDPAGAVCPATGLNECRSGLCDPSAPIAPLCTQTCTAEGGCGPGLGCFPIVDGADIHLLCARAGTRPLAASCASGRECDSGLCDATAGVCTRLCEDGYCPTGWTCEAAAGFGPRICRP